MTLKLWRKLHPATRALIFLTLCAQAAIEHQWLPQLLLFGGLLVLFLTCETVGPHYRWLLRIHLAGVPSAVLLFVLIGYADTRAWPASFFWGLSNGVRYVLRLENMLLGNLLFVSTTTPRELLLLLQPKWAPAFLAPLLSTALRFLPLSLREVRRIYAVQRCRGLRLRLWSPGTWIPLLVPLLLSQMCRSHDAAVMLAVRHLDVSARPAAGPGLKPADLLILTLGLFLCLQILL